MDTDVLIVGAGPTGLMLANQLARRGIRPMIIDRHSGPAEQSRAMAVHARTMEIYSKLGVADKALELGARGVGANMWTNGRWAARIPFGDIGMELSPFPFVLMLGQDDNEHILGAHLSELGVAVRWNTELVALEQRSDRVQLLLKLPGGDSQKIAAQWVCGCDGARSAVRTLNGISFHGASYDQTFYVADTRATGPMRPSEVNIFLWRDGFHLFFPMRGADRWRVIGILPPELRQREDLTFEEVAPAIRQQTSKQLAFSSCLWFSTYRIAHRAVDKFRVGRCFLAGDAAHIHSPAGGQGMNTGLQDAYNLAWKLALVVQHQASTTLLESYDAERLPVARRLLASTDRVFQLVVSSSAIARFIRMKVASRIAARAMRIKSVRELAFRTISQIGIAYPDSPLSEDVDRPADGAPKAGDRFPWMLIPIDGFAAPHDLFADLDDTKFNLILFGQEAVDLTGVPGGDLIVTHTVPDKVSDDVARYHITMPSYYLLRPDGHIGLCGKQLDVATLKSYMHERVRALVMPQVTTGIAQ